MQGLSGKKSKELDDDPSKEGANEVSHKWYEAGTELPGQLSGIILDVIGKSMPLEFEKFLCLSCVIPV
jgi:hypothetical protein